MSEYYLSVVLYMGYMIVNAILWRLEVFHKDKLTLPAIAGAVMTTCCFIICWQAMLLVSVFGTVCGISIAINPEALRKSLNFWHNVSN